nr:helix-turn-helix domain-containing protein [Ruminococcus sp. CAG:108]
MKSMIGMNLKYLRKKYGYSQEDLAERLEVSRQSVAKWENEESLPDVEKCVTMAQIFETTVEMLLVCPFYEEESDGLTSDGDGKYIFGIVKVSERGQITLPKHARKVFGIEAGDRLLVLGDEKKGMALAKIKNPFDKLMK